MDCRFLVVGAISAAAALACGAALAQSYPSRYVKLVITYPAGGSSDVMGRILGQKLTDFWGQQVVIESKPGAAGAIGMDYAARQPGDGYTLVVGNIGPAAVNPLISKVPYDVLKDFVPVTMISSGPNILVVHPQSPARSVQDLIALAKAQPGKLTYGSSGPGSMSHLSAELFKRLVNVDIVHVPYKGGVQWATDLVGGQLSLIFADPLPVIGHVRSGRLRALAVTSEKRSPMTPELPTLVEGGVAGFHAINWWGLLTPAGTPRAIVDKLSADAGKVLTQQEIREKFADLGMEPVSSTPEQFRAHIVAEMEKWGKLIKEANLRID
jgi:tripartite-type tricarboxylate transporter receptor subunit TctC